MSNDGERVQPASIVVGSMFGQESRRPLVWIRMGDTKPMNIPAEDARQLALNLLQAAEASEMDALMIALWREDGASDEDAGRMLELLRARREAWLRERGT